MRLVRIDVRPWTHISVRFLETRLHPVDPAGCIWSSIVHTVCLLASLLRLSFILLISFFKSPRLPRPVQSFPLRGFWRWPGSYIPLFLR